MNPHPEPHSPSLGLAGQVARAFIDSKLTPLIVITSVLLGVVAVLMLPREEEPQIKVPMIDVLVAMPGSSAKEVEERATRPMEKLLWEIPGVEYIYSTSRAGESLVIVRFKVGEDVERSLVKLNQKLQSNFDRIPHGVSPPLIKPKSIDDVPDPGAHLPQRRATTTSRCAGWWPRWTTRSSRCRWWPRPRSSAARGARCACCSIRRGWPRATSARPASCRCCSRPTASSAPAA